MKLEEIYQLCIRLGRENDPRQAVEIEHALNRVRKQYEDLKNDDKAYFDQDRLENPYSDTRVLVGEPQQEVTRIMAGIDLETQEVLLADRLSEKGQKIDLLLAHHPEGKALAGLHQVMHLQEDILLHMGVPINVAEGILSPRISEVERGIMPINHNRAVDAARLLGFALMCVHTPADNMVNTYLTKYLEAREPDTVGDVLKALKEIPEYQEAMRHNAGPKIVVGSEKKRVGKIMVDMTGGTGGSEEAYAKLAIAGVGTIVGMHIGEKHRKEAEKHHINVVIAGHLASDSLGMNLVLDVVEKQGIEVIPCSGLIRVKR